MYKVTQESTHAHILSPEKSKNESLKVAEVGSATHPAGYTLVIPRQNLFVLQFILSGSCVYNGESIQAPAMLYIAPNSTAQYKVDADCNDFYTCWFKCDGDMADTLFHDAGLGLKSEIFTRLKNADKIASAFSTLTSESEYAEVNDGLFMLSGLFRVLAILSASIPNKGPQGISTYTQIVLDYIHQNFQNHLTEKDMATSANLSTNYMHKVFLSDMKTTPINYLNFYRIKRAKELLRDSDLPVTNIAAEVGISGGDYFCRVFRKYNGGVSPTSYRKRMKYKSAPKN